MHDLGGRVARAGSRATTRDWRAGDQRRPARAARQAGGPLEQRGGQGGGGGGQALHKRDRAEAGVARVALDGAVEPRRQGRGAYRAAADAPQAGDPPTEPAQAGGGEDSDSGPRPAGPAPAPGVARGEGPGRDGPVHLATRSAASPVATHVDAIGPLMRASDRTPTDGPPIVRAVRPTAGCRASALQPVVGPRCRVRRPAPRGRIGVNDLAACLAASLAAGTGLRQDIIDRGYGAAQEPGDSSGEAAEDEPPQLPAPSPSRVIAGDDREGEGADAAHLAHGAAPDGEALAQAVTGRGRLLAFRRLAARIAASVRPRLG